MPTTARRRALAFATLDQVMPDVDRLLGRGYARVGDWTLGQICNHLVKGLVGSVDGFASRSPWLVRKTIGPIVLRRVLKTGQIPDGRPLLAVAPPGPDLDDRAEAEALRAAIGFFSAHNGPTADHPLFGRLRREQWDRLHCLQCAHFLSFAVPDGPE